MKVLDTTTIKEKIVAEINKKYGTIDGFLETDFGKSLGRNVKTYLYPSGAISYPVLRKLCTHLGLGDLQKETRVVRTVEYTLAQNVRRKKSSSKVAK